MTLRWGLAVCATALLAGCGSATPATNSGSSGGSSSSSSGGGSASSSGPPNACKVLTTKIATKELGSTAKRTRKAQPNPQETQCVYTSKAGGSISLLVGNWPIIKESGGGSPADKAKSVSGVGDEAEVTSTDFIAKKGDNGIEISAFKASGTFSGAAATSEQKQAAKLERKIALALLPRL
jgi:hypothetical protein